MPTATGRIITSLSNPLDGLGNSEARPNTKKLKVKAVGGSYSTAALRHIILLPK